MTLRKSAVSVLCVLLVSYTSLPMAWAGGDPASQGEVQKYAEREIPAEAEGLAGFVGGGDFEPLGWILYPVVWVAAAIVTGIIDLIANAISGKAGEYPPSADGDRSTSENPSMEPSYFWVCIWKEQDGNTYSRSHLTEKCFMYDKDRKRNSVEIYSAAESAGSMSFFDRDCKYIGTTTGLCDKCIPDPDNGRPFIRRVRIR